MITLLILVLSLPWLTALVALVVGTFRASHKQEVDWLRVDLDPHVSEF